MEWILTKDKLPTKTGQYLVTRRNVVLVMMYDPKKGMFFGKYDLLG